MENQQKTKHSFQEGQLKSDLKMLIQVRKFIKESVITVIQVEGLVTPKNVVGEKRETSLITKSIANC